LRADCTRCAALCCVAPAFARSADFAMTKPAGLPCPNLAVDFRCAIHSALRSNGFAGCAAFDCFGAGQLVTEVTFGGQDWRRQPEVAARMFEAFEIVRTLNELLWYLTQALAMPSASAEHSSIAELIARTERAAHSSPQQLAQLDVNAHREEANALLRRVSTWVREASGPLGPDHRGADLSGQTLRARDLRRADLRGALLIGCDLRDADLECADLTGADLRGADLRGADVRGALFVTQSQLDTTRGDRRTQVPAGLNRPGHWA
jgi:uncharacterized protein YjbI with pentapeptide repeats